MLWWCCRRLGLVAPSLPGKFCREKQGVFSREEGGTDGTVPTEGHVEGGWCMVLPALHLQAEMCCSPRGCPDTRCICGDMGMRSAIGSQQ